MIRFSELNEKEFTLLSEIYQQRHIGNTLKKQRIESKSWERMENSILSKNSVVKDIHFYSISKDKECLGYTFFYNNPDESETQHCQILVLRNIVFDEITSFLILSEIEKMFRQPNITSFEICFSGQTAADEKSFLYHGFHILFRTEDLICLKKETPNLFVRKTKESEIPILIELYAHAKKFMAETGNPNQWNGSYPEAELLLSDIKEGCSYVCENNGKIAATFYFRQGIDPTYLRIDYGNWLDDSPYGVVHRICVGEHEKGIASFCINWALDQCGNVRIDTHRENTVMQNFLKRNGFSYCGIIYLKNGAERLAFQKRNLP